MRFYDINGDGSLSTTEFINGLRELLNERRKKIVRKAFASVAKGDKAFFDDILVRYNVATSSDYNSGKKSRQQVIKEIFESMDSNNNGVVSKSEFYHYYSDVSMQYTHDEEFVRFIEDTWTVQEDDESKVFTD